MLYGDDRDYNDENQLTEEAEKEVLDVDIDMKQIRKEIPLSLASASTSVIVAWRRKTFNEKLKRLIARIYRANGRILNIRFATTFIRYKITIWYSIGYPIQSKVAEPTQDMIKRVKQEKDEAIA
jgi:hypothetical protein